MSGEGHDNWDSHWNRYAEAARLNPAQQMRYRVVSRLLRANARADARVLDIGSGQGDLLEILRSQLPHAELAGFELSESGVAISRRKVPDARFEVADLFTPPPQLTPFNAWATDAICSEVLEHVDAPTEFLRAAATYLQPGARLVVTVPGGPMSAFDHHIGHRRHFTRESITETMTAAGFSVDEVYLAGFPFFNLYRLVVIARGKRLATDVDAGQAGASGVIARMAMAVFRALFRLNLMNSPFGWQVVAVGRKKSAGSGFGGQSGRDQ
jgi:2-polyprenyl-3-methyl-5-hydroxy-6-metoxy-1,4-benzoquinol methylase